MYQSNYSQFDLAMEMLIANGFEAIAVFYAGVNDYLTKPFDARELMAQVDKQVNDTYCHQTRDDVLGGLTTKLCTAEHLEKRRA